MPRRDAEGELVATTLHASLHVIRYSVARGQTLETG